MKKSILLRLIIYTLTVFVFRVGYIIVGYFLGLGSSSDHFRSELFLDVIFFLINIFVFWIYIKFLVYHKKKYMEFFIISFLTLLFYLLQFIYFYQDHFFK